MDIPNQIHLSSLLSEPMIKVIRGGHGDIPITGIVMDNRKVRPGNLFVAVKGSIADGHDFIPDAIRRGAGAIIGEKNLKSQPVPYFQVENSRQALAWLAAAFYGHPGRNLTVIGVTGTDGKTTTCNLLYRILLAAGLKAGLISTVNGVIGEQVIDTGLHVTTPDAPEIQYYLARMVAAGLSHVVLETTSHGLAQYRVDGCEFDIGVITNITHEHLDQHGSFENYRLAKLRLFQMVAETRPKVGGIPHLAVLNRDDGSYEYLSGQVHFPAISYGLDATADVRAEVVETSSGGIHFDAVGSGKRVHVTSPLVGKFNVLNCLAALTSAIWGLGVDPDAGSRGIAALVGVSGRMERIDLGQSFTAIVDFAHTPNALKVALETARKMTDGRVIVVFGSAGLRDREKRSLMAEVAVRIADISILTAEDPRAESLEGILEEMAAGAHRAGGLEGQSFFRIPDRAEAIRMGVRLAQPGDIVISCGKGHEQSMCFGSIEYPWDDRTAMRAALAEWLGVAGPEMPYLPTQESHK